MLLGTRNTLYGLKVAPMLGWRGWRRVAAAHLLIDESTAMSITRTTREDARVGFLSTGLSIFVLWNLATLVGALAGDSLGDPRTYGLDAAVGGAFLALLWPRLDSTRNRVAAVLGAAVALCVVPLTPSGVPVLAASVVAVGMALMARDDRALRRSRDLARGPGLCGWAATCSSWPGCRFRSGCWPHPVLRRTADLLPVVLLAALVAVQVLVVRGPDGPELSIDARLAGLAAAVVALLLRAPFIVVVFVAALTAALLRL